MTVLTERAVSISIFDSVVGIREASVEHRDLKRRSQRDVGFCAGVFQVELSGDQSDTRDVAPLKIVSNIVDVRVYQFLDAVLLS